MLKREAQVVKLVDTRDLKSLGLNIRAGSTPALGTNKQLLAAFVVFGLCKITSTPPLKVLHSLPTPTLGHTKTKKGHLAAAFLFLFSKAFQIVRRFQTNCCYCLGHVDRRSDLVLGPVLGLGLEHSDH